MKRLVPLAGTACAVVACILFTAVVSAQQIQISKDNRTLAVTASGSASAMADTATVHIGFVAYGPDAAAAYARGSELSGAISKAVTAEHIAAADIQSESQSLNETPQFELEKLPLAEQAQKKFQLRQNWTVQTNAIAVAAVLNAAVNAGANQSGQIDWSVADESALEAQAAGKALARARTIAAQMAAGLGIHLGDLIYASNQAAEPRPILMRGLVAGNMPSEKAAGPQPLAINPRKIEHSATVHAVFAIQ